jgi:hypothetical protein
MVLADDIAGGWTDRELIEANRLRQVSQETLKHGWLVVLFWASERVTPQKMREEVLSGIYRDLYLARYGEPRTLRQMMSLEGSARAFAGAKEPALDADDLAYTREIIRPHLDALAFEDFPTVFACLFGDEPACRVGYPPLGLSNRALALQESRQIEDVNVD